MNLEDCRGRRCSFVTDPMDMGPRTLCLAELPPLKGEEKLFRPFWSEEDPEPFDPRISQGYPAAREHYAPLWREWPLFLDFPDLRDLKRALQEGASPEDLLGLGPGHTPAGDDWITGWLVGLQWQKMFQTTERLRSFERWFRKNRGMERTSWFSGEMIREALEGTTWARPLELLRGMEEDSPERVLRSAGEIACWGHTSGRAWLAGFAAALEVA